MNMTNTDKEKLITGTESNDTITNEGKNVTISAQGGNDFIDNRNSNVIIDGGDGNDSIDNDGLNTKINGGSGNDSIISHSNNITIEGGKGTDSIYNNWHFGENRPLNTADGSNVLIRYAIGDGNDFIYGFKADSTLSISGAYYSQKSGDDIVLTLEDDDNIILKNSASLSSVNIKGTQMLNTVPCWKAVMLATLFIMKAQMLRYLHTAAMILSITKIQTSQ